MSAIIYRITNTVNGKFYIGQTIRELQDRWRHHCKDARRGSLTHFHRAIRKYGTDAFSIEILEETSSDILDDRERYWIAKLHPSYNMTEGGEGCRGVIWTEERRKKLSSVRKGIGKGLPQHPNTKEALRVTHEKRNWGRGIPLTEEHKSKISQTSRGHHKSQETRERMRLAAIKRWSEKPDSFRKRNQSSVEVEQNGREDEM